MSNVKAFLSRLGLRYPIIQAPMANISTPVLAAAVSNAGGLGSIAVGASTVEQAREMIVATQTLTDKPFNVNVFCHLTPKRDSAREQAWIDYLSPHFSPFNANPPTQLDEPYHSFFDMPEMLALLLEVKPAVVSFHFNVPSFSVIESLKAQGIYTIATATNLDEAQWVEQAGIDAIVAQGIEAGGHRGMFDLNIKDEKLTTHELVILLAQQTKLPIIAAGGIMDGAAINALLAQGASAAQLGTAFLLCPESATNEAYRRNIISQKTDNTVLTAAISGRPARGISNSFTRVGSDYQPGKLPDYPLAYDIGKQLNGAATKSGNNDYAAHWAGQNVAQVREMPAKKLVETLVQEMNR